ncbi:MAG: hypothetical protein HQ453_09390 [Actinobacteria bacterium]|nr:hypothetical protein [Actinomycetota bacterium]
MIEVLNVVDGDSINILKGLRGATLRRIFGVSLDAHLRSADMSIETDRGTVTLWGDIDDLNDWEGDDGQYCILHIGRGIPDLYPNLGAAAIRKADNNSYYFHAGDCITDFKIHRETVRKVVAGEVEWSYTTDVAIVLELTNGVLAISKSSLNQEMLIISFADSFEELEIPPTGGFWFHWNAMDTAFQRSAEWMDREALIGIGGI